MMILVMTGLFMSGCEDGIRFPWNKNKSHEAEITTDTAEAGSDSLAVVEERADTSSNMTGADEVDFADRSSGRRLPNTLESGDRQWRVVVSSMPSHELAEGFIARHNLKNAQVVYVEKLDTYRVVYDSFRELGDAQVEFQLINSDFPEAWLVYF